MFRALLRMVRDYSEGRSPKWRSVRAKFLEANPTCAACGRKDQLDVHHVEAFHDHPEKELLPSNLIVLCMGATSCHFVWGHFGDWHSINNRVREDTAEWLKRVQRRP